MVRYLASFTFLVAGVAGCSFTPVEEAQETALPEVSFATDQSITDETIGTAEILLQLSEPSPVAVTVGFSVTGGTATPGVDLRDVEGTVTFPPLTDRAVIQIPIVDDGIEEPEEEAVITLRAPEHAVLGDDSRHDLRISATKLPRVRFVAGASSANEQAGTQRFAIELDRPATTDVVVEYRWSGTAEGIDHGVVDGLLTIPPGRVSATLDAPIIDDPIDEDDETLDLRLIGRAGAVIAPGGGEHVHTILDDDPPPAIGFQSPASTVAEAGAAALLDVILALPSEKPITIDYATGPGGTAGIDDYSLTPGTLTFPPGTTRLQIQVGIIDDLDEELDESVEITLANPTNALLSPAAASHVLTITDDDAPPMGQRTAAPDRPLARPATRAGR